MITQDTIKRLAGLYQASEFPNIVREYCQHIFLSQLYSMEGAENLAFKGGTALRIIYGSPRFSEDLDFSIFNIALHEQGQFIDGIFISVLAKIEQMGIYVVLGPKPGKTHEGYYGTATFKIYDYPPVEIEINVSSRNGRNVVGEIVSIVSDFTSPYNIIQLPQELLVEEKVFDALLNREKARDFYDLYYIMRKGLLTLGQKKRLSDVKDEIVLKSGKVDFADELSALLPYSHHALIKDLKGTLIRTLNNQLGGA